MRSRLVGSDSKTANEHDLGLLVGQQMDVFIDGSKASLAADRNLAFSIVPNGKPQSFSF